MVFASESDPEMTERISRHRADRPSGFSVVEATGHLGWLESVPDDALLLLDCLGTCLGLAMLAAWAATAPADASMNDASELPPGFAAEFESRRESLVEALIGRRGRHHRRDQ